jgi:hypothetical protein
MGHMSELRGMPLEQSAVCCSEEVKNVCAEVKNVCGSLIGKVIPSTNHYTIVGTVCVCVCMCVCVCV